MTSKDRLDMTPEVAQFLLTEGATLVITDVPTGTDFGIDLKSWNTGQNFKGIKMIPPGFHFIHYSPVDELGGFAPRIGFFHTFNKSEFVAKRWDSKAEDISSECVEEETIERMKTNLKGLDRCLGPYPYDMWKQWRDLTNNIDCAVVERCNPLCGVNSAQRVSNISTEFFSYVRSALELENCDDASRPRGTEISRKRQSTSGLSVEAKEELLLPNLKPKPGTELRLTELPDRNYPDGASPMEITRHSLDTSYALETVLQKLKHPMEIIGEMQLSFVCFLTGQSLDAFEHWKKLIVLICGADAAIAPRRSIYIEFLRTLDIQLNHVPEDFLCDIVANNNFVYHSLRKLFANIEINPEIDGRLKSEANRMKDRLTLKFLWDFGDLQEEDDDEAPVVVSIN